MKSATEIEAMLDGDERALVSAINSVAVAMMERRDWGGWASDFAQLTYGDGEAEHLEIIHQATRCAANMAGYLAHAITDEPLIYNDHNLLAFVAEREARIASVAVWIQKTLATGRDNVFSPPRVRDHAEHIVWLMKEREGFLELIELRQAARGIAG